MVRLGKNTKVGEKATVTGIEFNEKWNKSFYHLQPLGYTKCMGWSVPVGESFLKKI
jgi:hypothetical protein